MKRFGSLLFLLTLLFLSACAYDKLSDSDIKELVHHYSTEDFADDVQATITATELIVTEGNKETTYALPEDDFFLSIVPFVKQTHD